jgi:hypothetical protein
LEKKMILKSALVALGAAALIATPAVVSAHPVGYGDQYPAPYQQNSYGAYSNGYAYGYGAPQGYGYSNSGNRWSPQAYARSSRGWNGYSRYGSGRNYGYGGHQDEREYRGHGHHHHHDEGSDSYSHYDRD